MAGAKSGVHVVQLRHVIVPQSMLDGEKFVKWDEDAGTIKPVTLRVDPNGFFLYWTDQNKEVDVLDIMTIRDTRTGRYAKIPKDAKFRQNVTMGNQDTLEEKTVTICFGSDFVNLSWINFSCTRKDIAKLWTDSLLKMAYNLLSLNSSSMTSLKKAHTKLTLMSDASGKIPVKNVVKLFAQNKEDRKRVEKALDESGLASTKNEYLNPLKFTFEDFFNFYKNLTKRNEMEKVFDQLCSCSKKKVLQAEQFVDFLNKYQRDPRLNEILYPYANVARARDLIAMCEPNKYNAQKGLLSFDGFLHYILSDENMAVSLDKFDQSEDMDQPLPHYFINSSHNTYLIGHQLTGKSSVEMYRQCLLAGCRCVELDFWNGKDEPLILHGYTLVPDILAKDVIEAIAESAFKTSDYPVVLSFENHCNPRQQAKIAQYCKEFFGENLLEQPLETHLVEAGVPLPPPSALKHKIIIKNKKKHHHHHRGHNNKAMSEEGASTGSGEGLQMSAQGNGDVPHIAPILSKEESKDSIDDDEIPDDDDNVSSSDEDDAVSPDDLKIQQPQSDKGTAGKETEAGAEISALVNYVQPVHFYTFEQAEKRRRYYEMSSFDEKQATTLLKMSPVEFVNYNKQQLSRIYPRGTKVDSSNFMPQIFWNAGCQLVALNYQTLDLAMQLNLGTFEYNNKCGFLLKPEFMRRQDRRFDPFAESTVDGIIAGNVTVEVISGQFLTDKRVGTYVEVDMYGLPADTVKKKFRTKIVQNNGINPVYEEEPFVFKKVVLPELACIRMAAYEESGKMLGHRVLPVVGLCPGYRHIRLRNEAGQPLMLASLFVNITVKDYVPDGLFDLAEALSNPIKYQSDLEKRSKQLSILADEDETMETLEESQNPLHRAISIKKPLGDPVSPASSTEACAANHPMQALHPTESLDAEVPVETSAMELGRTMHSGSVDYKGTPKSVIRNRTSNGEGVVEKSSSPLLDTAADELSPKPLTWFLEHKSVKDKQLELERKLDQLRRKHDKEKGKWQMCAEAEHSKGGLRQYKLVKNFGSALLRDDMDHGDGEGMVKLLQEHLTRERELRTKYQDQYYLAVDKVLRSTQSSQLKTLQTMQEKETQELMRRIGNIQREEYKALARTYKDKHELARMKREVAGCVVQRGVDDREKLSRVYKLKREEMEREHEESRCKLDEERKRALEQLNREIKEREERIEQEHSTGSCGSREESPPL